MTQSNDSYEEVKLTIDIVKANVFALVFMVPVLLIFAVPHYFIWAKQYSFTSLLVWAKGTPMADMTWFFISTLVGIIAHELIHGLVWAFYAPNSFRSIRFGVLWKFLAPYCHCKEALTVRQYILGGLAPLFFLGLLPGVISWINGSLWLLCFAIFFTIAAAGDILIVYKLRHENPTDFVLDHPSEGGCTVYRQKKSS